VNEYLEYLARCEVVLRDLGNLSEAIDSVVDILDENVPEAVSGLERLRGNEEILLVQRSCHQRLHNVKRHIERLNRAFKGRNKALNILEPVSVKRITVLAAIFIPLSLSASILNCRLDL